MNQSNNIDKIFGPLASFGVSFFICTLLVPLYELIVYVRELINGTNTGFEVVEAAIWCGIWLFCLFFGAFIGLTTTCTQIVDAKSIKYFTKLFGIISIEKKWIHLTSDMKLGLKNSTKRWRAYGRSTSSILISSPNLRIILYDSKNREIVTVKKVKKEKFAEDELEKLSKLLELKTCFVRR